MGAMEGAAQIDRRALAQRQAGGVAAVEAARRDLVVAKDRFAAALCSEGIAGELADLARKEAVLRAAGLDDLAVRAGRGALRRALHAAMGDRGGPRGDG